MNPLCGEKRWEWARTKMFLDAHREVFDLEEEGENVMMRLRVDPRTAQIKTKEQQQACRRSSPIVGVWRRSGHETLRSQCASACPL